MAIVITFSLCPEAKHAQKLKSHSTYKHALGFRKPHVYIEYYFDFLTFSLEKEKTIPLKMHKRPRSRDIILWHDTTTEKVSLSFSSIIEC